MIKNLIFDLGGVILDLHVPGTLNAFSKLSGLSPEEVTRRFKSATGFEQYERGEMADNEFREFVRDLYGIKAPDHELDACWNAMLLNIPPVNLELLTRLKSQYNTYLLSNTNTIHLNFINDNILPAMDEVSSLDDYFHQAYYSHQMGMRKPEARIFQEVLNNHGLTAGETLFLDDNADNIKGANAVGIQTAHVNSITFILDYFND